MADLKNNEPCPAWLRGLLVWIGFGSDTFLNEFESRRGGHLALPTWDIVSVGSSFLFLKFKQTQNKVPQSGHGLGGGAARDLGSILAQGNVAPVMRSVFTSRPVATDMLGQLLGRGFLPLQTGDIEAVFLGFFNDLTPAKFLALTPHGDELPASGQAGMLWINRDSLQAPTIQTPVIALPI